MVVLLIICSLALAPFVFARVAGLLSVVTVSSTRSVARRYRIVVGSLALVPFVFTRVAGLLPVVPVLSTRSVAR